MKASITTSQVNKLKTEELSVHTCADDAVVAKKKQILWTKKNVRHQTGEIRAKRERLGGKTEAETKKKKKKVTLEGYQCSETITITSVCPLQWKMNELMGGGECVCSGQHPEASCEGYQSLPNLLFPYWTNKSVWRFTAIWKQEMCAHKYQKPSHTHSGADKQVLSSK